MAATNQTEKNKSLVRSFLKAVEKGEFGDSFDAIVREDYIDHLEGQQDGRDNLKAYLTNVKAAFPDLKWPIHILVAEGEYVAVYNGIEATHRGDFGPFKASGNQVSVMAFQLYRIQEGKLAEHWELADMPQLVGQLTRKNTD